LLHGYGIGSPLTWPMLSGCLRKFVGG
jgi:hypothetical protein